MKAQSARVHAAQLAGPPPLSAAAEDRDRQVQEFLPFIKYQVMRMASRLPHHVDLHDLIHAGILGLLDALDKYDARRGVQLKTYAEFRIRGAILDELRGMDWASRSTREKIKRLEDGFAEAERRVQRAPTEEEVAETMGLDLEAFHQLLLEARAGGPISVEELLAGDLPDREELRDWGSDGDPHDLCSWKALRGAIAQTLATLNERERMVLTLYYYEEMTMKEIGLALGVTESRVSQIHSQGLLRLRARLRGWGGAP
jgi:RNA polymerase sigma factor for flagellar operon FliA